RFGSGLPGRRLLRRSPAAGRTGGAPRRLPRIRLPLLEQRSRSAVTEQLADTCRLVLQGFEHAVAELTIERLCGLLADALVGAGEVADHSLTALRELRLTTGCIVRRRRRAHLCRRGCDCGRGRCRL